MKTLLDASSGIIHPNAFHICILNPGNSMNDFNEKLLANSRTELQLFWFQQNDKSFLKSLTLTLVITPVEKHKLRLTYSK